MAVANPINITVDNDFARFGSKSYAINKINTVEVRERKPHDRALAFIFGAVGALCLIGAIQKINVLDVGSAVTYLAFTLLLGWAAYWAWKRAEIIEYQLFLMTSSSSTQAYISRDGEEVMNLRDSIESAMVARP